MSAFDNGRRQFLRGIANLGTSGLTHQLWFDGLSARRRFADAESRPLSRATYYIDAADGSDGNSGQSQFAAWRSIDQANRVGIAPGDVLLLKGGQRHAGNLLFESLPTNASARVIVGSYGGGRAIIDPANGYGIKVKNTGYVTIRDIAVVGPGIDVSGADRRKTANTSSQAAGIEIEATTKDVWYSSVLIDGCVVSDCFMGIRFRNTNTAATAGYEACTIDRCVVDRAGPAGYLFYGKSDPPRFDHEHGGTLYRNCVIQESAATNIYGLTTYYWDYGARTDPFQNGFGFFIFNMKASTVDRCYATNCGEASPSPSSQGGGVSGFLFVDCDDITCSDSESNTIFAPERIDGAGFDADLRCRRIIVEHCFARNCDGPGLLSYQASDSVFRGNIIENCGRRAKAAVWCEGTRNVVVHNTIYHDKALGGPSPAVMIAGPGGRVINNIISVRNGATFGSLDGGPVMVGNCYDAGSGSAFELTVDGRILTSLQAIREAGYEKAGSTYGVSASPLFRAGGSSTPQWPQTRTATTLTTYDLASGSPCIDAGCDPGDVGIDPGEFDFHHRPLLATNRRRYTIGAVAAIVAPSPVRGFLK